MPIDPKATMKMKWRYESKKKKTQKTGITTPCVEFRKKQWTNENEQSVHQDPLPVPPDIHSRIL